MPTPSAVDHATDAAAPAAPPAPDLRVPLLLLTVLLVATCGLVYELLAGTAASYVLGDTVTQFSTVIGAYLAAMGLGSFLSRYIEKDLARQFIHIELAVALIGGALAPVLFLAYDGAPFFRPILYSGVGLVGVLVGLEIPLLIRILKGHMVFRDLVARVLTADYLGALAASILFPLLLVPHLGLVRTSLAFGALNAAVALWSTWLLRPLLGRVWDLRLRSAIVLGLLGAGLHQSDRLTLLTEVTAYGGWDDEVVYATDSRYHRIVLTQHNWWFRLFLNGQVQFSSYDEYRYHEALVHPAMAVARPHRRVLVLGGGDGLAVREVLRHADVDSVTLVDIDPEMTRLARELPVFRRLNGGALDDPRVRVINDDAMTWLESDVGEFDVIVADFPGPSTLSVGKLFTTQFYQRVRRHLSPTGALAVQASSPYLSRRSFWCVVRTLEATGFRVRPYHAPVPSFSGDWGFALAALKPFDLPTELPPGLRFLNPPFLAAMFQFPEDSGPMDVPANQLDTQILVQYYGIEWRRWQ